MLLNPQKVAIAQPPLLRRANSPSVCTRPPEGGRKCRNAKETLGLYVTATQQGDPRQARSKQQQPGRFRRSTGGRHRRDARQVPVGCPEIKRRRGPRSDKKRSSV